ncbi:MAG: quinone-dependent dihydroorotate dehydrogenase [Methylacidiphilales bacterium]|nr:quinone-dependent dihydroorotate dehydrogenase [Candidatus Methylacidiphilales bacterium]MDW8348888.1 quinone-dependent dihydroorotate dehydrogenase [Verrucomicrobiae bacterium]
MNFYRLIFPILSALLPPEPAHQIALKILSSPLTIRLIKAINHKINFHFAPQNICGAVFPNPIGLAAGFDKNAEALPAWQALGFGFVEIGTVTPLPQDGNPKPRLFRVCKEHALINRMGFPNIGAAAVAQRLSRLKNSGLYPTIPIGINVAKNKNTPIESASEDYAQAVKILNPYADYFTLNISSPNTPGLRLLQSPESIQEIVQACRNVTQRPLFIKLAPDLDLYVFLRILEYCRTAPIQGLVLTNTLLERPLRFSSNEKGGISGRPLHHAAVDRVRIASESLSGTQIKIIGVGGIESLNTLRDFIDAGAHLVQLYTGLVYQGPSLLNEFARSWHLIQSQRPL